MLSYWSVRLQDAQVTFFILSLPTFFLLLISHFLPFFYFLLPLSLPSLLFFSSFSFFFPFLFSLFFLFSLKWEYSSWMCWYWVLFLNRNVPKIQVYIPLIIFFFSNMMQHLHQITSDVIYYVRLIQIRPSWKILSYFLEQRRILCSKHSAKQWNLYRKYSMQMLIVHNFMSVN